MDRRQIIRLVGGTAAFATATAWPRGSAGAAKIARVGIIDDGPDWEAFRQELHELNYIEGQNIAFEYRQVDGTPDRLAAAAHELAQGGLRGGGSQAQPLALPLSCCLSTPLLSLPRKEGGNKNANMRP